jgi:hypothetical protein
MVMRFISQSGSFKITTSKSGTVIASCFGWNAKDDDELQREDARLIEMDAAVVAAIRLHAPEFEVAYLDDNLPRWFQRVLDHCTTTAEHAADYTDAAFIEALSALLDQALGRGQAMADHDAPGIVPEADQRDRL